MTASRKPALIPEFDPLDCDVGLRDAVYRYLREQEEIALLNDEVTGKLLEAPLMTEATDVA